MIKLPHFKIEKGSIHPFKLPRLMVSWYKSAGMKTDQKERGFEWHDLRTHPDILPEIRETDTYTECGEELPVYESEPVLVIDADGKKHMAIYTVFVRYYDDNCIGWMEDIEETNELDVVKWAYVHD